MQKAKCRASDAGGKTKAMHHRPRNKSFFLTPCGSGGTGRRTILRGWRRKAWGFESPLPHQLLFVDFEKARAAFSHALIACSSFKQARNFPTDLTTTRMSLPRRSARSRIRGKRQNLGGPMKS